MASCPPSADLKRYVHGALDSSAKEEFRAHLDVCDRCRAAYERFRADETVVTENRRGSTRREGTVRPDRDDDSAPSAKVAKHFPKIEGYHIVGVVGQGGMGIVYRAIQQKLNRKVALKVLPAIVGSASPAAVSRFRREAMSAARLHHTNIIPIYDFGESSDSYYCAMELVNGKPLDVVIDRLRESDASIASPARLAELLVTITAEHEPSTPRNAIDDGSSHDGSVIAGRSGAGRAPLYYRQVARWMVDAAEGLHYAHSQGIIHRDIKPSNLILSTDGRTMIADFGLAKDVGEPSVTLTGSLLGTLRYMSPEQAMAKRVRVDHRTDLYSLGATMYELLTFQPAFGGTDDKEILSRVITRDPTPPRKLVPSCPQELELICLKSMEKSPSARYDTGRALAEDLRRYINDLPIAARRQSVYRRTLKFVRRHRAPVIATAAVILLVTMGSFYYGERTRRIEAQVLELIREGVALSGDHRWDRASTKYEEALRLNPRSIRALGNFAILKKDLYNSLADPDPTLLNDAYRLCDKALALAPDDLKLWNVKGVLLRMSGRYEEAVAACQKRIELERDYFPPWANLAVVYAILKENDKAEEHFREAVDLTETEDPYAVFAWRGLAALRLFQGESDALDYIKQAIKSNKSDPASWLVLARVHLELESQMDTREALIDAEMADRLAEGKDGRIKRVLALARLRNDNYPGAVDAATAAIAAADLPTINHLILAIAETRLGHHVAAAEHLESADAAWPAAFADSDAYEATADKGVLWFETAATLHQLRREADRLIAASSP